MIKITKKQDIALQLKYGVGYIEYANSYVIVARSAYLYSLDIVRGPWELGEKAISTDPFWSYTYVRNIIKAPWPPGEKAIATDPSLAYRYCLIIRRPWKAAEKTIADNPKSSCYYAKIILKHPWKMGEKAIATDPFYVNIYCDEFGLELKKGKFYKLKNNNRRNTNC